MTTAMRVFCLLAAAVLVVAPWASAVCVTVPGTADPYLAGMPDGSTASYNPGSLLPGDVAPANSPVLVPMSLDGPIVTFATGWVEHFPAMNGTDPDGRVSYVLAHFTGAENGISDISAPINALLGVFLDDNQPDGTPAPAALDFSSVASRDYLTLSPELKQLFFIGDGRTSANEVQTIYVPAGATRLFLGPMDGFSWNDNSSAFEVCVEVIPVPAAESMGIGLLGALISLLARRRVI